MANSVDPDQTAPIGAVCSGSTMFASILNSREGVLILVHLLTRVLFSVLICTYQNSQVRGSSNKE